MKKYFKQNFMYICIFSACLSLLTYLIAFSCELSRILDTRRQGNDSASIFLCTIYFVLFLSATILINGLATRMGAGLFIWSLIISLLAIPELWLIMMQFWGLESNHGIAEVVGYFIRLIINCIILIHVIPLALKWRKEKKILKQLESLAARLQLTSTATPSANFSPFNNGTIPRSNKSIESETSMQENDNEKITQGEENQGFYNQGYLNSHPHLQHYASQNEFDASIFGMNPSQYIGPDIPQLAKRTQSLLDLRFINTSTTTKSQSKSSSKDKSDTASLNSYDTRLKNNLKGGVKQPKDPLYHTLESSYKNKGLGRNCISLENLGVYVTDEMYNNNIPNHCCPPQYPYFHYPAAYFYQQPQHISIPIDYHYNNYLANTAYFNNSATSIGNSKQSLDDFRKYRDVAL